MLIEGSSLAAAHVTRMVWQALIARSCEGPAQVREWLRRRAIKIDSSEQAAWQNAVGAFYSSRVPTRVDYIERAVLYPFNKEMHALVRFRRFLPFEIAAVVDPPGKRLLGRDAGEAIGAGTAELPIMADLGRALAGGDTLIIGHTEELRGGTPGGRLPRLLARAAEAGKHVFSFSQVREADLRGIPTAPGVGDRRICDPMVRIEEVERLWRALPAAERGKAIDGVEVRGGRVIGRMKRFLPASGAFLIPLRDCPVLGVFGTSRSQGKFTLQMALRECLGEMGYRVAHFATEPTGMLLGASVTLPLGYQTPANFGAETWSFLAEALMTEVKNREQPDILLVGGQSGVAAVAPRFLTSLHGPLLSMAFGMACQPDACVLVCNLFDTEAHIRRCIGVIESAMLSRVLALAFNNAVWEDFDWHGVRRRRMKRLDDEAMEAELAEREGQLGLPSCGIVTADGPQRLARIIVDFFASFGPDATSGGTASKAGGASG